jgi:hypothetical protein
MTMYPNVDPNGNDFFAYSYKAADLVAKILSAATAFNNMRMDFQSWSWNVRSNFLNLASRMNACI